MHIRFEFKQGYTEPSERNCTLQSRSLKIKLFIFLKMKTSESNNMLRNKFFIQFEKSETFLSIQIYIHSFISFQLEPFIQHQVEGQQSLQRYSDLPLPSHGLQHFLEKHYLYSESGVCQGSSLARMSETTHLGGILQRNISAGFLQKNDGFALSSECISQLKNLLLFPP